MKIYILLILFLVSSCGITTYRRGIEYVRGDRSRHAGKPPLDYVKYVYDIEAGYVQINPTGNIFISKFELTNWEYRDFLVDMRSNMESYQFLNIDSLQWTKHFGDKLNTGHYFKDFDHYPVVNVSFEGANKYCEWLTNQMNSADEKYIYKFRLPTSSELELILKSAEVNYSSDYSKDYAEFNFNLKYKLDTTINYSGDGFMYQGPVYKLRQNSNGLCSIVGNVGEYDIEGNAYGGSWDSFPSEVNKSIKHIGPDPRIGIRLVMEKMKK